MPVGEPELEPRVVAYRQIDGGLELDLRIDADLPALAGHFPGLPIVPGVCLLDWVIRLSARHLALLPDGARQFQIKFRRVLQPGEAVTLSLRRLSGGRVQFDYKRNDTIYASGTVAPEGA
ncbi:hydroxymyristoyl-ACP dehydratase [soil metagenome]